MQMGILNLGKYTIKRLLGSNQHEQVWKIYEDKEYLEAYTRHTDLRVEADPKSAIGGMWEKVGRLQFEFLLSKNLKPNHTMLDIGCGTLRGGQHFIRHLNPGNYYGIDISPKAVAYAKHFVQQEYLSRKDPHLILSENKNLKFQEFSETFDCILAQSVFTHLKPEHIQECFQNIGRIMHETSSFYFTYFQGIEHRQTSVKDFCYPSSFFESLAAQYYFRLEDCSREYDHPRGQSMIKLTKH